LIDFSLDCVSIVPKQEKSHAGLSPIESDCAATADHKKIE